MVTEVLPVWTGFKRHSSCCLFAVLDVRITLELDTEGSKAEMSCSAVQAYSSLLKPPCEPLIQSEGKPLVWSQCKPAARCVSHSPSLAFGPGVTDTSPSSLLAPLTQCNV